MTNQSLKSRFPFRLGTSSYIVPADIEPNVEFLADKVDDIEIVLFESDEFSNIPSPETVDVMADMAAQFDLTYTIHLPLDTYLGDEDESVRRSSVDKCLRIIERMNQLKPFAYVLHFHGDRDGGRPSSDIPRWVRQHRRSVEELLSLVEPWDICVETLSYPFELIESVVSEYDLSVCLDIGHLLLRDCSLDEHYDRYLDRTRIVHLHGIEDGKDHTDISHLDDGLLDTLIERLCEKSAIRRVLTLEIFSEQDFNRSIEVLRRYAI